MYGFVNSQIKKSIKSCLYKFEQCLQKSKNFATYVVALFTQSMRQYFKTTMHNIDLLRHIVVHRCKKGRIEVYCRI